MLRRYWVAALMLVGASTAAAQTVGGVVRDAATSRPIVGAVVALGTITTRTDDAGSFLFAKLPSTTLTLVVRRLGYEPSRQNVDIAGDVRLTVPLRRIAALDTVQVRAAPQAIYGVVATATDLRPLSGATVQMFGANPAQVTTDSTGHFFYAVKAPGAYLVRARVAGLGAQSVSVTVNRDEGVEVALLLDSLEGPRANAMEVAYAEFRERLLRRTNGSAIVPRAELTGNGNRDLVSSLLTARSFGARPLRFSSQACLFVDGEPRAGWSPNAVDPEDIETVEVYTAASERSGTLARRWGRSPCGDTGMPRALGSPGRSSDLVQWVVIWLKR